MSYPLIRETVKENGGILASAVVLSVRDIPETEGDDMHTLVIEHNEVISQGNVQADVKLRRGDIIDVHADESDDPDGFCKVTLVEFDDQDDKSVEPEAEQE